MRCPEPAPARPIPSSTFHSFSDAAAHQPSGAAGPGLPTALRLNGAGRAEPSPGPAQLCCRDSHGCVCLLGSWIITTPQQRGPVSLEVPGLLCPPHPTPAVPVTRRTCHVSCLPVCPQYSPFILEKSDSALKVQLRSHLLQEVGPACLPLICIKCLFPDVPGLRLAHVCPMRL